MNKVKIFSQKSFNGQQVKFTIGNQTFSLSEIIEENKEDENQVVKFYIDMLRFAFDKLEQQELNKEMLEMLKAILEAKNQGMLNRANFKKVEQLIEKVENNE